MYSCVGASAGRRTCSWVCCGALGPLVRSHGLALVYRVNLRARALEIPRMSPDVSPTSGEGPCTSPARLPLERVVAAAAAAVEAVAVGVVVVVAAVAVAVTVVAEAVVAMMAVATMAVAIARAVAAMMVAMVTMVVAAIATCAEMVTQIRRRAHYSETVGC